MNLVELFTDSVIDVFINIDNENSSLKGCSPLQLFVYPVNLFDLKTGMMRDRMCKQEKYLRI